MKFFRVAWVLTGLALILIVDYPHRGKQDHSHWDRIGWIPFVSPPLKPVDVLGNVVLGAPAGLAIARAVTHSVLVAGLLTAPVSLVGEWTQVYSHGRFPSATDFVCNVAGAMAAAAWSVRRGSDRHRQTTHPTSAKHAGRD